MREYQDYIYLVAIAHNIVSLVIGRSGATIATQQLEKSFRAPQPGR